MSGGLMALAENPEQFELVRSRHELIRNLVAESLLPDAGAAHARTAATMSNCRPQVTKGDKVVMVHLRNRDEKNRTRRRIHRRSLKAAAASVVRRHPSLCWRRLTEQQLRILWVLQRNFRLKMMGPPQRLYSNFIRGIRALPVQIVSQGA
jgi:hypothetical protein